MERKVLIIGGGASGMMAAIHAAREGAHVTILEHMDRVGKKILSTGNGRCNLTNLYQGKECYRSQNEAFPMAVIDQYPVTKVLGFFENLGILPKSRNGYMYPNSDQASSVLDVLRSELAHLQVETVCGCSVKKAYFHAGGKKQPVVGVETVSTSSSCTETGKRSAIGADTGKRPAFCVETSLGLFQGDCLILAAGGKAAPVTGSDGSGYDLAKGFGHTVIPPLPALVQLRCKEKHYKQLAGIRTEAGITLYVDGKEKAYETGELQLTDFGISGIPVFQLSRYASRALYEGRRVTASIDFLPQKPAEETRAYLQERKISQGYKTAEEWMTGILNKKLALVLLRLAGIQKEEVMSGMDDGRMELLLRQIKSYQTEITAANPFENAQVCCGGVDTREVNRETMESRLVPGLYFAGELLDVDGICGGYNLQWAWSSGALAGIHAGRGQL